MKYTTEQYSQLLEGRLPTSALEFELCDRLIELQKQVKNCSIPRVSESYIIDALTKIDNDPNRAYGLGWIEAVKKAYSIIYSS